VFLPTPVEVPEHIEKAAEPTVCFVSRWDKRKRPEIFFELARTFPNVRFIAAGASRNPEWDAYLRETYGGLPNLEMAGFIDQFASNKLAQLLDKSWIMVNTAAREGLPNSFIEALAHGCALLSEVNPDGFASQYGYAVSDGNFTAGLRHLLDGDRWRGLAERGYNYVRDTFALDRAIARHLAIYSEMTGLPCPEPAAK
jgi:glycosyltransferase involved in cell wall biosynthesis